MSANETGALIKKNARVVVVGLGSSGIAACRLLASRGVRVTATDARPIDALSPEVQRLADLGVEIAVGGHHAARLAESDLIVVSPGVAPFAELEDAERLGVPIWGEVELAVRALYAVSAGKAASSELSLRAQTHEGKSVPARSDSRPRLVAIGGTNGKSTVTSLVGAMLERAGWRVFVGGNLGEPLAAHVDESFDVVVLEVSSFQMERVDAFHPDVAVLLNVTPDHLERYADIDAYAHAKGNAFVRQTRDDLAVVPVGDSACGAQARRGCGRVVTFGAGGDIDVQSDCLIDRRTGYRIERSSLSLVGGHNALNIAAALAAVQPFAVPFEVLSDVLCTFSGLPHRMAFVREVDGVRFYDDSKGTNVGAAVTAVRGVAESAVVLIAGGRDKGGSYEPLVEALVEKGRGVVLIGEAAPLITQAVGDTVPVRFAASMAEAVQVAREMAQPGDAVLLSPACSSFDMFVDYKHRGDVFVAAVRELVSEARA